VPYLSLGASAVVIHYEEALYQVYAPLSYLLPLKIFSFWGSGLHPWTPAAKGLPSPDPLWFCPHPKPPAPPLMLQLHV